MKNFPIPLLVVGVSALTIFLQSLSAARSWQWIQPVQQSATELYALGDFDGSGTADVVIADRQSGLLRFGLSLPSGSLVWTAPVSVGARDLNTGMAVGYFRAEPSPVGVAITTPAMNRVQVFHFGDPGAQSVYPAGVGPAALTAIDYNGDSVDDLLIASRWNNAPQSGQLDMAKAVPGGFSLVRSAPIAAFAEARHPSAVRLTRGSGSPEWLGLLLDDGSSSSFLLLPISQLNFPDLAAPSASLDGLPSDSRFDSGLFGSAGAGLSPHFLFRHDYQTLRLDPLLEGAQPGSFEFIASKAQFWSPGSALASGGIHSFAILRHADPAPDQILVAFDAGPVAVAIFDYDGIALPTLHKTLSRAEVADAVMGIIPLSTMVNPSGEWLLLTGSFGGRTQTVLTMDSNANVLRTSTLPEFSDLAGRANVFFYDADPSVVPSAQLIATRSVGAWTRGYAAIDDALSVSFQNRGNATQGLIGGGEAAAGSVPQGTVAIQTNQRLVGDGAQAGAVATSLFSMDGPLGEVIENALPDPLPGTFNRATDVVLSAAPGSTIWWRKVAWSSSDPWQSSPSESPPMIRLLESTTLQWYIERGNTRSTVASGTWTIDGDGDSDGDGVPDVVEDHYGLDPNGGADSDGDGYTDLEELIAGTNPADPADFPPFLNDGLLKSISVSSGGAYGLNARLRSPNGRSLFWPIENAADGTTLNVRTLRGTLSGSEVVTNNGWANFDPINYVVEFPYMVIDSPTAYFLDVADEAVRPADFGREMVALFRQPDPVNPVPDIPLGFGDPAVVVAQWVADLQAHFAVPPALPVVDVILNPDNTLLALAFEHIAGGLLGIATPTIVPNRPADSDRTRLPLEELIALARPGDPMQPAYDVTAIVADLESRLFGAASGPASEALRDLVLRIYTASTFSPVPEDLVAPIDAIRSLLAGNPLPEVYLENPYITTNNLSYDAAVAAAVDLVNSPLSRPAVVTLQLQLPNGWMPGNCASLPIRGSFDEVILLDSEGAEYPFPAGVPLAEGVVLEVIGYPDVAPPANCFTSALEVVSIRVIELPISGDSGSGGGAQGLLPGEWSLALFGTDAVDPFVTVEADGQSYTLLQLYLEGADPYNLHLIGGLPAEDLSAPEVEIVESFGNRLQFSFRYPARYADALAFELMQSSDLNNFQPMWTTAIPQGGGEFFLEIDPGGDPARFFVFQMGLKRD